MILASLAVFAAPAWAGSPIAEVICDDQDAMRAKLERTFGATRQGRGLRGPDAVIEVWSIPGTGEWTLVQTYASGKSCIVAMGEDWELLVSPADPA